MPEKWRPQAATTKPEGKPKNYTAANGSPIANEDEKTLKRRQGESGVFRGMKVQVGDVTQGLMCVADMVDAGHRVVFDDETHVWYAEHKKTGIRMYFTRTGKTCKLEFEIAPCGSPAFRGQSART